MLYDYVLVLMSETIEGLRIKLKERKEAFESNALKVYIEN